MAIFKRSDLRDQGLTDEQIEYILSQSSRVYDNYITKSAAQEQAEEAVRQALAKQPQQKAVTEFEEYKDLLAQNTKLTAQNAKYQAFNTEDFAVVKKPYQDIVWDKLDHGEKHKDYSEQLKELAEKMPDIFVAQESQDKQGEATPKTPQFGSVDKGTMPTGKEGESFSKVWGFVPENK
jgi:hypothetical protein